MKNYILKFLKQINSKINKNNLDGFLFEIKQQEENRKKYLYIGILLNLLFFSLFYLVINKTEVNFNFHKKTGFTLIFLSSVMIFVLTQISNRWIKSINVEQPSKKSISIIKKKLQSKKSYFFIGSCLQIIFIVFGIQLLVFSDLNIFKSGMLGVLFAYFGLSIGFGISIYNLVYKPIIKKVNVLIKNQKV